MVQWVFMDHAYYVTREVVSVFVRFRAPFSVNI
jgi:hypothetical protein